MQQGSCDVRRWLELVQDWSLSPTSHVPSPVAQDDRMQTRIVFLLRKMALSDSDGAEDFDVREPQAIKWMRDPRLALWSLKVLPNTLTGVSSAQPRKRMPTRARHLQPVRIGASSLVFGNRAIDFLGHACASEET